VSEEELEAQRPLRSERYPGQHPGGGGESDPEGPDDRQLLQRIVAQDRDALDILYSRYCTPVYSLALHMLKQPPLAEEVTQDVFLNIWLKAASFNAERGQPRSWIMSVAHHRVVDVIRSRRRTATMTDPEGYETLERIPSGGASVESQVQQNLDRERIMRALSILPETQKDVILLAYYEGFSQSEMAERLGLPLGTIKTRVRLAMQKLRAVLQEDDDV
jgi:RNA polymerase sigma-70 factor (ECF subfamily)